MKKNNLFVTSLISLAGLSMVVTGCNRPASTPAPEQPTLTGITLSDDKVTQYLVGDTFIKPTVTANYSDLTTKNVTASASFTGYDMNVANTYTVTVTYQDKNASYQITVTSAEELQQAKETAIRAVSEAFDKLDLEEYSEKRKAEIITKLNEAINAIRNARTVGDVENIRTQVITYFNRVPRAQDITKGTWFDVKSAESTYELDRDDNNNLVITYDGRPGNWVYLGTRSLKTNLNENNYAYIKFSNDIADTIEVCIQLTGEGDYKVDSHVFTVPGNTVKEVKLDYYTEVSNFYFFLDSCSDHNRKGQVTILETSLRYDDTRPEVTIPYSKTIPVNEAIVLEGGHAATYTLTEEDQPLYISRVDANVQVNFHGNGDSKKWFGLHLYAGSDHNSYSDSQAHTQEATIDGVAKAGINAYFQMPILQEKKLVAGNKIEMDVSYQAENLTFQVLSYTFFYSYWKAETTETVEVNTPIYVDGQGKDASNNHYTATIPYSSFKKTGKVISMDVNFTTVNTASYGKSQIYFTGFSFTSFTSGNNNVLNIGKQMNTDGSSEVKAGSTTIYPTEEINLKSAGQMTIVCWWASAKDIIITSLVMHTENEEKPKDVTGLEAHPIDSGVVLTWAASQYASSYEVYVNGEFLREVASTYLTIDGLTNGQTYTFKVVAKNSSGTSTGVTVEGTPMAGATYDTFIEGLNTNLEVQIGETGIQNIFNASSQYAPKANNYRLKKAIEKMKNGEETTVGFFGGSITVGETAQLKDERNHAKGYAYYTYQWLKRNYDVDNKSRFVNGSICGTGSEIGIVRAQKDLLDYNPDIIFIEFAGNNGTTDFYNSTYESLIRKCMALPSDPAIVLVFCVTYYSGDTEDNYMVPIGTHYNLPMYSINKGLRTVCGTLDKERTDPIFRNYSSDGTHPTDEGHQLMSKALCYFLRNQISKDTDTKNTYQAQPSSSGFDKFQALTSVDNTNATSTVTSLGSFVAANTATVATRDQSDVTAFQQGWRKNDKTTNEAMTIKVTAKNFVLIYGAGNPAVDTDPKGNIIVTYINDSDPTDTGTLTWDVSKTIKQSHSGSTEITDQSADGWGNPVGVLIFDKTSAASYTITIKMQNSTDTCSIMAFGYTA